MRHESSAAAEVGGGASHGVRQEASVPGEFASMQELADNAVAPLDRPS
jgi:hypothetical protein